MPDPPFRPLRVWTPTRRLYRALSASTDRKKKEQRAGGGGDGKKEDILEGRPTINRVVEVEDLVWSESD